MPNWVTNTIKPLNEKDWDKLKELRQKYKEKELKEKNKETGDIKYYNLLMMIKKK